LNSGGEEDGESRRIEELLRVNAELAAEIRSLTLSRTQSPRSAPIPAARRTARRFAEREEMAARLASAEGQVARLEHQNRELRDLVDDQRRQIERLRSGFLGLAQRAQMRIRRD
jgi:predicted RNase H-like nuclease (RuvC/YqgF family)